MCTTNRVEDRVHRDLELEIWDVGRTRLCIFQCLAFHVSRFSVGLGTGHWAVVVLTSKFTVIRFSD